MRAGPNPQVLSRRRRIQRVVPATVPALRAAAEEKLECPWLHSTSPVPSQQPGSSQSQRSECHARSHVPPASARVSCAQCNSRLGWTARTSRVRPLPVDRYPAGNSEVQRRGREAQRWLRPETPGRGRKPTQVPATQKLAVRRGIQPFPLVRVLPAEQAPHAPPEEALPCGQK